MKNKKIAIAAAVIIIALVGLGYILTIHPSRETMQQVHSGSEQRSVPVATPDVEASGPLPDGFISISPELPRAVFVGTRENMHVPNLAKPRVKPRPPFLAPAGTTNVAKGKPVTASDVEPVIGEIEMITDGDKEAADGSYVEFGPFKQHVTIDLGDSCNIYAIIIWHYHKTPRVYFDVACQIGSDPDFVTDVHTVFNNDTDNSLGLGIGTDKNYLETYEGKLIDTKGVRGRYVRLYSNGNTGNDLNHYTEVEVYAVAAD